MSEFVARILRAAGEIESPRLRLLVFAEDRNAGASLVDRLTGMGGLASLVDDEVAAIEILSSDAGYDGLVVTSEVPKTKVERLAADAAAARSGSPPLAVVQIEGGGLASGRRLAVGSPGLFVQTVPEQKLDDALRAIGQSSALASADVRREFETIARAVLRLGQRLYAVGSAGSEIGLVAAELEDLAGGGDAELDKSEVIASLRHMVRERRLRERFFSGVRFGEPAWDILLDLTLAWYQEKAVSLSSLAIASGVPISTAMRWINEMVGAGLIERWTDPTDGRRNLVKITPAARRALLSYLTATRISIRLGDGDAEVKSDKNRS